MDAQDVIALKTERVGNSAINSWHDDRIAKTDELYRGDVAVLFQDETTRRAELMVPNIVQLGLDDIARLVSESVSTVRCPPKKNSQSEKEQAKIRENIAFTYWESGAGDMLEPKLALDLAGTGACFLLCEANQKTSQYPQPKRLDPRNCFPDLGALGLLQQMGTDPGIIDTPLGDLIHVVRWPLRRVQREYGMALASQDADLKGIECEIIDYYDADVMVKVVSGIEDGKASKRGYVVQKSTNPLGRVPVAFAQMDTLDGQFRGVFDQAGPIMKTLNRLYVLMQDDADRRIYSQVIVHPDISNPQDIGIPGRPIIASTAEASAATKILAPETASPTLFPLMQQLERFMHISGAYPEQRGGEVNNSIASATFVSATLGVLTTQVKNIGRLLAFTRRQWNSMAFSLDEKELNFSKPLSKPVGNKYEYLPGKDLNGVWTNRVVYSPGVSTNELNERVGLLQAYGAGLISAETVTDQLREVPSSVEERQKRDLEDTMHLFKQKLLAGLDPFTLAKAITWMQDGDDMGDVARKLSQDAQAQQAAAQQAQPEGQPGVPPGTPGQPAQTPEQVATQQTALEKGGTPPTAPAPSPFAPPPFTTVRVQ